MLLNGISRKKHFVFGKRNDLVSEKYKDFLELFLKQLLIQSRLISLAQIMHCVLITNANVVSSNVRYVLCPERVVLRCQSNPIPFNR